MNYLSDYTSAKTTELFDSTESFFAFSNEQFSEKKKEGVKYTSLGAGLLCPSKNVDALKEGLKKVREEGIKQDILENGKEKIIIRELYNHECFYTNDLEDVISSLNGYDFSEKEISKAFYKERANADV